MKALLTLSLALLCFSGCEGDVGPMGPAGPQGPPGEDGDDSLHEVVVRIFSSNADAFYQVTADGIPVDGGRLDAFEKAGIHQFTYLGDRVCVTAQTALSNIANVSLRIEVGGQIVETTVKEESISVCNQ